MRALSLAILLALAAMAHAISYTVQVAAVSDQDAALSLVRQLLRDGYPAYFVRTATDGGSVFRIRVGAFENRAAAVEYADAMPDVAGGRPVPALAEAIPGGIMPLVPMLLLSFPLDHGVLEVVPWNGAVAVRSQPLEPLDEATYHLLLDGRSATFRAWVAAPVEAAPEAAAPSGAVVRVRGFPLWPDAAQEEAEEVRSAFRSQMRSLIADSLGVAVEQVEAAEHQRGDVPTVTVVERFDPWSPDDGELLGLGDPAAGFGPRGPGSYLVGGEAVPEPAVPLVRFEAADGPEGMESVEGAAWSARADGAFTRVAAGGSSWRAAVGEPLWAREDLLITLQDDRLLVYRLQARAATATP